MSEIERAAMKGEPMPRGLNGADTAEYLGLFYLYKAFYANLITREDASEKKKSLRGTLSTVRRRMAADKRLAESNIKLYNTIAHYVGEYIRDRSLERADQLHKAIYGILRDIPIEPTGMWCPRCDYEFEAKNRFCCNCGIQLSWDVKEEQCDDRN